MMPDVWASHDANAGRCNCRGCIAERREAELEARATGFAEERDRAQEANALAVEQLQRLQRTEDAVRVYLATLDDVREKSAARFPIWRAAEDAVMAAEDELRRLVRR